MYLSKKFYNIRKHRFNELYTYLFLFIYLEILKKLQIQLKINIQFLNIYQYLPKDINTSSIQVNSTTVERQKQKSHFYKKFINIDNVIIEQPMNKKITEK